MKKAVLFITLICITFCVYAKWFGGDEAIVSTVFPSFATLPETTQTLAETQAGEIYYPSFTPFDLDVLLNDPKIGLTSTGVGTLMLPEKASAKSPVPAMIILHGSGGISPGREMEYARLLNKNGYAAMVVDYFRPRGVTPDTPYMMRIMSITEIDAMVDAYSALKVLSTHPAIKAKKIGLMGFSYGAIATRFAMDDRFREILTPESPGFAAFIDFYGPCFQNIGTQKTNGSALLTLRGTDDASNDLSACKLREIELRSLGINVETHILENAGHAWDVATPQRLIKELPYISGCEINYDKQGYPLIEGQYLIKTPTQTSRDKRIIMRIDASLEMSKCFKFGYTVGNDQTIRKKSDKHLLTFLRKSLG